MKSHSLAATCQHAKANIFYKALAHKLPVLSHIPGHSNVLHACCWVPPFGSVQLLIPPNFWVFEHSLDLVWVPVPHFLLHDVQLSLQSNQFEWTVECQIFILSNTLYIRCSTTGDNCVFTKARLVIWHAKITVIWIQNERKHFVKSIWSNEDAFFTNLSLRQVQNTKIIICFFFHLKPKMLVR